MKHPPINYHDYLKLDKLLSAQSRRSEELGKAAHDEMLFVTVHQAYEIWFKQIIFELDSVLEAFAAPQLSDDIIATVESRLSRIHGIIKMSLGHVDILETMTPLDFLDFRDYLYPASGFQSFQFRLIETKLGLRTEDRLTYNETPFHKHLTADQQTFMLKVMDSPSLFDSIEKWLERIPFLATEEFNFWDTYKKAVLDVLGQDIATVENSAKLGPVEKTRTLDMLNKAKNTFEAIFDPKKYEELRKAGQFRLSYKAVHAALLIQLYREKPILQMPFRILNHLLDLDEVLTQWRARHAQMVQRMLGHKIGTGGSSGHQYLKDTTEKHKIFQDFFSLASFLIPRSKVPPLPASLDRKMSFS